MANNYSWELYTITNIKDKEELDYLGYHILINDNISLINVLRNNDNIECIIPYPYGTNQDGFKLLKDNITSNNLSFIINFIREHKFFAKPNTVNEFFKNNSDMELIGSSLTGIDISKVPEEFKDLLEKKTHYVMFPSKEYLEIEKENYKKIQPKSITEMMIQDDTVSLYWDALKPFDNNEYCNKIICVDTYSEYTCKSYIHTVFLSNLGLDTESAKYTYFKCFKNNEELSTFIQMNEGYKTIYDTATVYPMYSDDRSFEALTMAEFQSVYKDQYSINMHPTKSGLGYMFNIK